MSIVLRTAQSDAIGFAPIAGVPPVGRQPAHEVEAGGTPYPQANSVSRGSEFNQLAPHAPEWLIAPRSAMSRQHRCARALPVLEGMARHG
ncbi:MAG: hypothetical protein SNJ59_14190 [Aggregatilineales bacterium]